MYLYLFAGLEIFRHTYSSLIVIATVSVPFTYLSGVIEWRERYKGVRIRIFSAKLKYGIVLFAVGSSCSLWYSFTPGLLQDTGGSSLLFILLNTSSVPIVAYLGHLGGRLVYGGAH